MLCELAFKDANFNLHIDVLLVSFPMNGDAPQMPTTCQWMDMPKNEPPLIPKCLK